jgi:hypothetical protein
VHDPRPAGLRSWPFHGESVLLGTDVCHSLVGHGVKWRGMVAACIALTQACSGASRLHVVPPRYPNLVGTVVASRPDTGGEVFARSKGDVTLILQDGQRFVLSPSTTTFGVRGLLCRTRDVSRADGTYAPPCRFEAYVVGGRARWVEVIGAATVGTAVGGSAQWIVLADGTAIPMPRPPSQPLVNCPSSGVASVESFTRRHRPVRITVNDNGSLARVDCLSSAVKP